MSLYLDASVIVSIFKTDIFSDRAEAFLRAASSPLHVSDFASAEFFSAIGRLKRTGELTSDAAQNAIANFDGWRIRSTLPVETLSIDVQATEAILRRLDLVLRAPDALNIAIARRIGAELATFDVRMAECARALGVALAPL